MCNVQTIGAGWASEMAGDLTDEIIQRSPVECNQELRFLPSSETKDPGFINFDRTPYWIEPMECFDVRSDVREVDIMKGVQTAYSTVLRSIVFYFAVQIRTSPGIYANVTIDQAREIIDSTFIPMFQQSGLENIFQSHDEGNSRKRGVTKNHIQWVGGGHLIPKGGQKAHMMREIPALFLLLDEIDAYPDNPDGDPIGLFLDRTTAFDEIRKVLMGCTPTVMGASRIHARYLRGDQRKYMVPCLKCGEPQEMRFSGTNRDTGKTFGLKWDMNNGQLDINSIRYHCQFCDHPHSEYDKSRMITKERCKWVPTATPVEPGIRSYHLPNIISRRGRWVKCVSDWLDAYDVKTGRTKSRKAMKKFYNNILAMPFEEDGEKLKFRTVSSHRRSFYTKKQIPNKEIEKCCVSGVLFLTMTVDVHPAHLNVSIWGWTAGDGFGFNPWLVDYYQITDDSETGFETLDAPGWEELAAVIDDGVWKSDDGKEYRTVANLIDSGWAESTVLDFCRQWPAERCVWPIKGDKGDVSDKGITNFKESKAKTGELLYVIKVSHYKDRIAPALRRRWRPEHGTQRPYVLNLPTDTTDDEIKELTREWKKEEETASGKKKLVWHRPHGADNELWDLLVYGHASVEILAWLICVKNYGMESVDWSQFWEYCRSGVFYEAV